MRITFLLVLSLVHLFHTTSSRAQELFLGQGCMAGEVTSESVLLQTRLTSRSDLDSQGDIPGAKGVVAFEWSKQIDFREAKKTAYLETSADRDFIVRVPLTGLEPNTVYYYRAHFGFDPHHTQTSDGCRFKTLPGQQGESDVHFVMGSCMNYNKFLYGEEAKASGR